MIILIMLSLHFTPDQIRIRSEKLSQFVSEKKRELYRQHPEYKKYMEIPDLRFYNKLRLRKAVVETLNVAVLRVEFLEDSTTLTTGNGKMQLTPFGHPCDTIINTNGGNAETTYVRNLYYDPPHDSIYFHHLMEFLHNYYWAVSHGKLFIKWTILPLSLDSSFTVPHKMTYYGDPENYVLGLFSLLRDAVQVSDPEVDFSLYDRIVIFHAGSMWQTDIGNSPYDLPAVFIDGADQLFGEPIIADGDSIYGGVIYCETGFQDSMIAFLQGGLCHEFAHSLGAIDLYDVSGQTMGCGGWSLMGTGNWNELGLVPPRHDAWHREYLGFDTPVVIDKDTANVEVDWNGDNDSTAVRLIKIPINKNEYYLIENRYVYINPDTFHYVNPCTTNIDSNGARVWKNDVLTRVDDYESSLPPDLYKGGLLIWHIDQGKIDSTIEYNEVNAGFPHGIDIEEADGIQDFEKSFWDIYDISATFYGSPLDVFAKDAYLDSFTQETDPNTNDNRGAKTFIRIKNISASGPKMYFDIQFENRLKGFPVEIGSPTDVVSPIFVDSFIIMGDMTGKIYKIDLNGDKNLLFDMGDSTYTTPAVSDIDNDGVKELVSGTIRGDLYILNINDGTTEKQYKLDDIVGSPSIADINGDKNKEILIGDNGSNLDIVYPDKDSIKKIYLGQWVWTVPVFLNGYIYVLSDDGTLFKIDSTGRIVWRRGEESLSFTTSSPVAADIDRDGKVDIVYSAGNSKIYCYNEDGDKEWEYSLPGKTFFSSPAIGDINKDGYGEIFFSADNKIYVLNHNGVPMDFFPLNTGFSESIQSSIVLFDTNGDSIPEIIYGSPDGGIYGIENDGKIGAKFPLTTSERVYSTPLIVVRNDSLLLFSSSDDGLLYGWFIGKNFTNYSSYKTIYYNNEHIAYLSDSLFAPTIARAEAPDSVIPESDFYIYPSPVISNNAKIRYLINGDVDKIIIQIFSTSGRKIFEQKNAPHNLSYNEVPVSFTGEANGIFFVVMKAYIKGKRYIYKKSFGLLKGGY